MEKNSLKSILYSKTFKGYLRASWKKVGNEIVGMTLNFCQDKKEATTFPSQDDIVQFQNKYCIGVNYNFQIEYVQ